MPWGLDGCAHDEEDAGSEPACGSLARVGVARRELAIHLDASDETHHGTDGVDELRAWIKVGGHHTCCLVYTCKSVALRECL